MFDQNNCDCPKVTVSLVVASKLPGARHRLPVHYHALGQEGWGFLQDVPDRRGQLDPALRQCLEPQHRLPHAVPRRVVCLAT